MRTVLKKFIKRVKLGSIKSYVNIGLFFVCILILVVVPLIRPDARGLVGDDAYFHLRIAENFNHYDSLSYGGRYSPYVYGLPFVLSFSPLFLAQYLPLLLGILSFILFWLILKKYHLVERKLVLLLLLISPPFIYLFTTLNSFFVPVFLILLGFYLLLLEKRIWITLGVFMFMILPFFSFRMAFLVAFFLLFFGLFAKRFQCSSGFVALGFMGFVALLFYAYLSYQTKNSASLFFTLFPTGINDKLIALFSDLGGLYGLGIFAVILTIFGIMSVWHKKYRDLFLFFGVALFMVFSFLYSEAIFFLNFFIAVFAAKGFFFLYSKQWMSETMKRLTFFVLISGLLFSTFSFVNEITDAEPTAGILRGIEFLSLRDNGVVFSYPTRGKFINAAGKMNVMDTHFLFASKLHERWRDTQTLLYTRDINEAQALFAKYNIKYVWVDDGFRNDVWTYPEEGLLFLLKYNPNIELIYNQGGMQIWEIR